MANSYIGANVKWETAWIEIAGVGNVKHAAILNICSVTNVDAMNIAPNNGQRPYWHIFTKCHIANNDGWFVNINIIAELGCFIIERF